MGATIAAQAAKQVPRARGRVIRRGAETKRPIEPRYGLDAARGRRGRIQGSSLLTLSRELRMTRRMIPRVSARSARTGRASGSAVRKVTSSGGGEGGPDAQAFANAFEPPSDDIASPVVADVTLRKRAKNGEQEASVISGAKRERRAAHYAHRRTTDDEEAAKVVEIEVGTFVRTPSRTGYSPPLPPPREHARRIRPHRRSRRPRQQLRWPPGRLPPPSRREQE